MKTSVRLLFCFLAFLCAVTAALGVMKTSQRYTPPGYRGKHSRRYLPPGYRGQNKKPRSPQGYRSQNQKHKQLRQRKIANRLQRNLMNRLGLEEVPQNTRQIPQPIHRRPRRPRKPSPRRYGPQRAHGPKVQTRTPSARGLRPRRITPRQNNRYPQNVLRYQRSMSTVSPPRLQTLKTASVEPSGAILKDEIFTKPAKVVYKDPEEPEVQDDAPLVGLVKEAYKSGGLESCVECDVEGTSSSFESSFATAPTRQPQFLFRLCDLDCDTISDNSELETSVQSASLSDSSDQLLKPSFQSTLFDENVVDEHTHQVRPAFSESFHFTAEEEVCPSDTLEPEANQIDDAPPLSIGMQSLI